MPCSCQIRGRARIAAGGAGRFTEGLYKGSNEGQFSWRLIVVVELLMMIECGSKVLLISNDESMTD